MVKKSTEKKQDIVQKKGKHPGGRPTKYNKTWHPKLVEILARQGTSGAQIAKDFGIAPSTLNKWMLEKPEFSEAIKRGKDTPDQLVQNALYQRAIGFEGIETKVYFDKDGDSFTRDITKQYPPDPTSMIFWLKNRRPEQWREKQQIEHSGNINLSIDNDDAVL